MDYLWTNYSPESSYVLATESRDNLCEALSSSGQIRYINPLGRLQEVFIPILNEEWNEKGMQRDFVEDLFLHTLAWLDNLSGLRPSTLTQTKIRRKLLAGDYGEEVRKNFQLLDRGEKKAILHLLQQKQDLIGESNYFLMGLRALYPEAIVYKNEDDGRFIVLMPMPESPLHTRRIALLEELFLALDFPPLRYFWERRIGLIENPETMRIGHITLY